jgi:hypothetical protein
VAQVKSTLVIKQVKKTKRKGIEQSCCLKSIATVFELAILQRACNETETVHQV